MMNVAKLWKKLMELPLKASRMDSVQTYWFFAYHKEKCKEHDFCGALQGCGGGEDIQCLLNAVDDSVNALEGPIVTPAVIHSPAPEHSSTQMASVADSINLSNPFPPFPLPFGIDCCTMSLSTLGDDAREILIGGFGKWLPSHVAMRFREIQGLNHDEPLENLVSNGLLLTAQNTDEFLEIFGMAEMMATCQELLVDRGAMARFFTVAGHALYTSCKGKDCVVEYGQTLGIRKQIADAVRRDIDTHPATRIMVAVGIQYENIVEIPSLPRSHAMPDHGGPTDICPQDHLTISNSSDIEQVTMNDPSNIYDSRSSAPAHIMCDNPNLPYTEESPHEDYMVDYDFELTPEVDAHHSGDESRIPTLLIEPSRTPETCVSHISSDTHVSSLICVTNPSENDHEPIDHELVQQASVILQSPPLKSRLRDQKKAQLTKSLAGSHQNQGLSKPGRPIVFAAKRPAIKRKATDVSPKSTFDNYTIEDLLAESRTGTYSVVSSIESFLMDPKRLDFVKSTMASNHDSWLAIAVHVASLLRRECMPHTMRKMAMSFMAIELWIEDIAIQCNQLVQDQGGQSALPPLAHYVIVELSSRALSDEQSAHDHSKSMTSVIRYLLRVSRPDENDIYAPALWILSSVLTERSSAPQGYGNKCNK
ncbi:hypothetical protein BDR06DRAFT_1015538 [Suillus hirtellus]|nr:hypothetical protein BDR06DRAFT_1015538 [Suillus hirtellus]